MADLLRVSAIGGNAWSCSSPLLEPTCQFKGFGERLARVMLLVDIETGSRGVWLGLSSSEEIASPTGIDRIRKTPEEQRKK